MSEHQTGADEAFVRSVEQQRRPTVVGIGASAGGLQALKQFMAAVPRDSGLAYVVVMHLPSDRESHLADLLQPHASIPVTQVADNTALEPNHAYIIPPDCNLSAVDSHLRLTPLEKNRGSRAPVDHFFRTMAESLDGQAVAVVLTGTGSDGALGVRRVRERGGFVVVQDPTEAEFDGMPRSAIDSGAVDIVLPLEEIPQRILELDGTRPQVRLSDGADRGADGDEKGDGDPVPRILTQVRMRTGHDFSRYKRSTIERRIERRMQLNRLEKISDHLDVMRTSPQETAALADDLLINVTSFFRDRSVFEELERSVIPSLFEGKGPTNRVRVWSVGCATGEEAYTLGILLLEEASRREHPPQIQIFASDLHERSLHIAREGVYPETIATDVSPERLARFFQRENGGYRVRKELRELIVFAPHNLVRDPPFSHLDLIACRNVLIYLRPDVQNEVQEIFHYALHGEGYLLLGTAEMVNRSELFRLESKEHHLYRRRNAARADLRLPTFPMVATPVARAPRSAAASPIETAASYGALHQRMVERYAPPSLLVDAEHNVLHVSEQAGRYLQVPGGLPSTSVFRLVREELRTELRAALLLARERRTPFRSKPIPLHIDGELHNVLLRVSPAGSQETEGLALVIFDEIEAAPAGEEQPAAAGPDAAAVREIENELEMTRGRLGTLVEEFESSQEEMRASNEELQSANEELRSTMEELETGREELQSINEELQTLNQENRHKVEELSQLSGDLQNLLKVTDIATLFLDRNLRINRFTPRVGELFNVRLSDRGRPLADLTHRLGYGGLLDDARQVLESLIPTEREVETHEGAWYLIRVLPYRTVEDRIEGVVITFVDITALKKTEGALRASDVRFRAVADLVPDLLWESAPDGSTPWFNARWYDYTGQTPDEAAGWGWVEAIHPDDRARSVENYRHGIERGDAVIQEQRIRGADGTYRWFLVRVEPHVDERGRVTRWFGAATDIHAQRLAILEVEQRVEERTAERDELRRALSVAEEAERQRLARELHDEAGQQLTALGLGLESLSNALPSGSETRARAASLRSLADSIARELHALAVRLRPKALDDFGLSAAITSFTEAWSAQSGVKLDVHADIAGERLPPEVETAVYRIVQEALANVAKHSKAKHASVVVELREESVVAIIEDDGIGFDVSAVERQAAAPGREGRSMLGLLGIRERAALVGGTVELECAPGRGTTLFVRIPVVPPSAGRSRAGNG